jgi:uncharacterized protein YfdQ (DUF2303 family)
MKDLIQALRNMINPLHQLVPADDELIALADGYALHSLERYRSAPDRTRAQFATRWPDYWAEYVHDHGDDKRSAIYVSDTQPVATAYLDAYADTLNNTGDDPGWAEHRAELRLQPTPVYTALSKLTLATAGIQPDHLVDLLLDFPAELIALGGNLETATELPLANALHQLRNLALSHNAESQVAKTDLTDSRSLSERHAVASEAPTGLLMNAPLYEGLPAQSLLVRITYVLKGDKKEPELRLRILELAKREREMIEHFQAAVSERLQALFGEHPPSIYLGSLKTDYALR